MTTNLINIHCYREGIFLVKTSLEAPLQALCASPAHLQTDLEVRRGVRERRAKRSGMAQAIRNKKAKL